MRESTHARPASVSPVVIGAGRHTEFLKPELQRLCLSVDRNPARAALVQRLHGVSGPTAVTLKVTFAVVTPFNRVFWTWTLTHVFEKVRKQIPASADLEMLVTSMPLDSIVHGVPRNVRRTLPANGCMPMRTAMRARVAHACGSDVLPAQVTASSDPRFTARATAAPKHLDASVWCAARVRESHHRQLTVHVASLIDPHTAHRYPPNHSVAKRDRTRYEVTITENVPSV